MWKFLVALGVGVSISGCTIVSSDVASFDLDLPPKAFSVDANGWQVRQADASLFLQLPCASSPNVCSSGLKNVCPMNCTGSCNSTTSTCDLHLEINVHRMVDVLTEQPQLASVADQSVIQVSIDRVTYEVTANTLDTATADMQVYIAPMSVTDTGDAAIKHIATIPSIPAQTTVVAADLAYTPTGKKTLSDAMGNFKTPFNIIVGSALDVSAGQSVPSGKLDASVRIRARASL
jgi:hypothetical protein